MHLITLACANLFEGTFAMFLFAMGSVPLMLGFGSFVSLMDIKVNIKKAYRFTMSDQNAVNYPFGTELEDIPIFAINLD